MRYIGFLSRWFILPLFMFSFTLQAENATPSTTHNEVHTTVNSLSQPKAVKKLTGSQLIKKLKSGGYVIFMRHVATEEVQDEYDVDLENCETQRNLSEKGKKQAKIIGDTIKKLAIPIGDIHSSPYCRCMDTAKLVFGQEANFHEELSYAAALSSEKDRAEYSDTLVQMLSIAPDAGTNTVIVSHSVNLEEAIGIQPKPEGVMHVFKPTEEGYEHIGEIKPDFWEIFLLTAP